MSNWLDAQPDSLLRDWLCRTRTPMLATDFDGEILWINESFEDLLGWTDVEIVGKRTWRDLTADPEDLAADIELAQKTKTGERTDYQLQKQYITKSGDSCRVVIDVLRYPLTGDFQCFLVSVFPTDRGVDFAMGQLTEIRTMMLQMLEYRPTGLTFDKIIAFHKNHPVAAWCITAVLTALLFGERVSELIKLVIPKQ